MRRLHMVGNGHLDVVWLWQAPEGLQEVKATFRSALDRMDEYAGFKFVASSAAYYEWIEENDPEMFDEIRRRVSEGRWELAGGWWVEPDCNLPGGEALVRQALLGQRYFLSRFGRTATVGYNVDSFGHAATLPQLLAKSGLTSYVFMRPAPHEKGLPGSLFRWESDDGSQVLAYRLPYEYCTPGGDIRGHIDRCAAELDEPFTTGMCFYGVGNHGGGPTRANIDAIQQAGAESNDLEIVFSSPAEFFREAAALDLPLPTVHDELQHHASGCYSAHSGIKAQNRRAEQLLLKAEKLCSLAAVVTGRPYPAAELAGAWKSVLFNQFHDVLGGTSIEPALEDALHSYGEAIAVAGRSLNQALQALAWRIDIPRVEGSLPIVVFNPHAWPTRVNVELESDGLGGADELEDDTGRRVDVQTVTSLASVGEGRRRISFDADLPALGYRVYRTTLPALPTPERGEGFTTANILESALWRLEFDASSGELVSLWDKREQCEVLAGPARAVVIEDPSDTWGHGVLRFQDEAGAFKATRIELVERGPVKSTLRVQSAFGRSRLVQDYTVFAELEPIEVRVLVDWREQRRVLKLRFPVNVRFQRATYEIPFGRIERPANGEEEPGQGWIDLSGVHRSSGQLYGMSVLNDAKQSYDVRGREISLTVLRSPAYAHHDPHRPQDWEALSYLDQGIQRFTYALLPHTDGWETSGTVQRAAELNQRPIALIDTTHKGTLRGSSSFVSLEPSNVVVTALKAAEDGDGDLVLRCYETSGRSTRATLTFFGRRLQFEIGRFEIKTLKLPKDGGTRVLETDLLERPLRPVEPEERPAWTRLSRSHSR